MNEQSNSSQIDLSIIIPTRNHANALSRTLESILDAEVPEGVQYEIIVIDNNSTDDTPSLIEKLSETNPHLLYLFELEKGASNARNLGIKKARGNILLFAAADAPVHKNWIKAYWRLFEDADVCVARGKALLQGKLGELPPWLQLEGLRFFGYFNPDGKTAWVDQLSASNMAVRKGVFDQYGLFSPHLGPGTNTGIGEDYEFAARLNACEVKIHYEPDAVVYHAVENARTTKEFWRQRRYQYGYSLATTEVLVNWQKPRRLRSATKLVKYYLKSLIARSLKDESRLLRCERKSDFCRGFLRGARDSTRWRRLLCKRKQKLSACLITQNSAHCIARALRSVESFCDEIIVVDGGSQDKTREIVESFKKVKYYCRPWTGNYIEQKNWAINQAQGDWVLSIDSDEVVGANMARKILKLMKNTRYSSYMFPRYWLVSESPSHYVESRKLYPDYQQRLFRNIPKHRYTRDRVVHHKFPNGVQGRGKKVKDIHIFHFDFIYHDRPAREKKVKTRLEVESVTGHINQNQYLYEDHPYRIRRCREKLHASAGANLSR